MCFCPGLQTLQTQDTNFGIFFFKGKREKILKKKKIIFFFFFSPGTLNIAVMKYTRNEFLKLTGMGISGVVTNAATGSFVDPSSGNDVKLNFGLTSYTFRNFTLDDTIKMTLRLGLTNISLKAMHMPLESSADDIKRSRKKSGAPD